MFISKKVISETFENRSLKNNYKKLMIYLWEKLFLSNYKPDFDDNEINIEAISIQGKDNKLTVEINTSYDFKKERELYCKRCKDYGGLDWTTKDCDNCKLNKFIIQINKRLNKRANIQRKKIGGE